MGVGGSDSGKVGRAAGATGLLSAGAVGLFAVVGSDLAPSRGLASGAPPDTTGKSDSSSAPRAAGKSDGTAPRPVTLGGSASVRGGPGAGTGAGCLIGAWTGIFVPTGAGAGLGCRCVGGAATSAGRAFGGEGAAGDGAAGGAGPAGEAGDGGDKSDPIMAGEIPAMVFLPKPDAPPGPAVGETGGRTAPATPMAPLPLLLLNVGVGGGPGAGGAAAGEGGAGPGGPPKLPGATPIIVDFRFRAPPPGRAPGPVWDGAPGTPGLPGTTGGTTAPAVTVPTFGADGAGAGESACTRKECPHFEHRILSPAGGTRRSST
jgi:hypothetical protein